MIKLANLWPSRDQKAWEDALDRYCEFVKPPNMSLEKSLDALDLGRIEGFDARGWYAFLRDEYFRWKYTAPNRYVTTINQLKRYEKNGTLNELDQIRRRLLSFDINDIRSGLRIAKEIHGLGTAGASGLLALMFPQRFGTVDQFVVKALKQVEGLPEAADIDRIKPEALTDQDGELLIQILRRKAVDNNRLFNSDAWTPRKLDKILWTYGR